MKKSQRLAQWAVLICLTAVIAVGVSLGSDEAPVSPAGPAQTPALNQTSSLVVIQPHDSRESAVVAVSAPVAQRDDGYDGPLAELVPTNAQAKLLFEAEEAAVATCMNERGFEYLATPYLSDADSEPWNEPIAPGDVEMARTAGYGIQRSREMDRIPPPEFPNEKLLAEMSPDERNAWDLAFMGSSDSDPDASAGPGWVSVEYPGIGIKSWNTNSCLSQAKRDLYTDDRQHAQNGVEKFLLIKAIRDAVREDADLLAAKGRWRTCMRAKGYDYQEPGDPERALWDALSSETLSPEELESTEIALATADADCYLAAGVAQARRIAEARAEVELRQRKGDVIARLEESLHQALKMAEQLVPEDSQN